MRKKFRTPQSAKAKRITEGPADPAKRETLKKLGGLALLAMLDATAFSSCGKRMLSAPRGERKVLVVGLDGLDPKFVSRLMAEGKLPKMSHLQKMGGFSSLKSSIPPQSPVAWASISTGLDPSGHHIYDFIHRDPKTYFPYFSIARSEGASRTLALGKWRLPLSHGKVELMRAGRAFWEFLDEKGIPVSAYRVPTNFPPKDTGAKQLAGLGAPDLLGTYGEFSFFTDAPQAMGNEAAGGTIYKVSIANGKVKGKLIGPANTLREGDPGTFVDFEVWVDKAHRVAKIVVPEAEMLLREGEWSDWVLLRFELIPHVKYVDGMCRFYLKEVSPHFKLYATPINIDPMNPALPITAPAGFSRELGERFGRFYTQGFPEDVKALRRNVLDDGEYLQQSDQILQEVRRMYEASLQEFDRGVSFHYFSTTDRTQHMFWRTMDPRHPAYDAKLARAFGSAIEDCYLEADKLVGQALDAVDGNTTLIVLSDHGFGPYYRSFNLNSWLAQNGYLAGVSSWGQGSDLFSNANWEQTSAYGIGFNALYVNLRGREDKGVVNEAEREGLLHRLAQDLMRVRDPKTGNPVISNVYLSDEVYASRDPERAPDIIVGYAPGYRCSDGSVLGEVSANLIEDNTDKWSGDHCMDCAFMPGVLLANKPFANKKPALVDIAASILSEFGIPASSEMQGKSIW